MNDIFNQVVPADCDCSRGWGIVGLGHAEWQYFDEDTQKWMGAENLGTVFGKTVEDNKRYRCIFTQTLVKEWNRDEEH